MLALALLLISPITKLSEVEEEDHVEMQRRRSQVVTHELATTTMTTTNVEWETLTVTDADDAQADRVVEVSSNACQFMPILKFKVRQLPFTTMILKFKNDPFTTYLPLMIVYQGTCLKEIIQELILSR